jgi:hypothetical protein
MMVDNVRIECTTLNAPQDADIYVKFWGTITKGGGSSVPINSNLLGTVMIPARGLQPKANWDPVNGLVLNYWPTTNTYSSADSGPTSLVLPGGTIAIEIEQCNAGTTTLNHNMASALQTNAWVGSWGDLWCDVFMNNNGIFDDPADKINGYYGSLRPCITIDAHAVQSGPAFTGTVNLPGWANATLPQVKVNGVTTTLVAPFTATSGTFTLATLPSSIQVKAPTYTSVTLSSPGATGTFTLGQGDCTDDNLVDDFDFAAVVLNFGGAGPAGNCNGDSIVDDFDFAAVVLNFGTVGS